MKVPVFATPGPVRLEDAQAELAAEILRVARDGGRTVLGYLDELLTVEDVARHVRVEPASVYRWLSRGMGPRRVKLGSGGGPIRFRRGDVLEWVRARTVEPRRDGPRRYRQSLTKGASHATAATVEMPS